VTEPIDLTDEQMNRLAAALAGRDDAIAGDRDFIAGLLGSLWVEFDDRGNLDAKRIIWYAIKEAAEHFDSYDYHIIDFITDTGIFEVHDHGVYPDEAYEALRTADE
jgi:hypothetical protein